MAKRRAGKGARKKRAVLEILGVILVLVCGFITVAPQLNLPFSVPTWQEIFSSAKLTELSEAANSRFPSTISTLGKAIPSSSNRMGSMC